MLKSLRQGWRTSAKTTHFIRAICDHIQEEIHNPDIADSSEEWMLQYLDARWHPSILDAIDDDKTGYVTVTKLNRFMAACPEGWRYVYRPLLEISSMTL